MSRIATLTTILAIAVAPAALARPADYRSADPHTTDRAALAQFYRYQDHPRLPSSHANVANVKLIPPAPAAKPSTSGGGSDVNWALLGVTFAALAAAAALAVKAIRQAGPPAHA